MDAATAYLPWLWIVGSPLTFALLATGLVGARRLRESATVLVEGPIVDACQRMRTAMGVVREVTVAACDSIAQPILVGIVRPCILLPASSLAGWSADELEMVLLHELAHVRRWDNLVNLMQRMVESLLFFHPAVWLVSRQVRRDREDCCDAVVVGRTQRAREYAELLVSVAALRRRELGRRGQAPPLAGAMSTASALADHPLAGRIRRILKLEDDPMLVSRSTIGAAGLAVAALVTAALLLPLDRGAADDISPRSISDEGPRRRDTKGQTIAETTANDSSQANRSSSGAIVEQHYETTPELVECLKILASTPQLGVTWKSDGDSLIVSATPTTHEAINAVYDDIVKIKQSVKKLRSRGKSLAFPLDSDDQAERDADERIHELFMRRNDNPRLVVSYDVGPFNREAGFDDAATDMLAGLASDPYGPRIPMTWNWIDKPSRLNISAPRTAHVWLRACFDLNSPYWTLGREQKAALETAEEAEEGTTKDAKGTKAETAVARGEKAAAPDEDSETVSAGNDFAPKSDLPGPFLSADDQRATDFIYGAVEWEVEPITPEEASAVRKHGYEGGVRIIAGQNGPIFGDAANTKILVGLHTTPIKSIQELADFLLREQTPAMSPLRAYLLTKVYGRGDGETWSLEKKRLYVTEGDWQPARTRYLPPRVVQTWPDSGAVFAASEVIAISVQFSQPMQDGSWSWATDGSGDFPKTTGRPGYTDDARTCVLPVKLEPGKHYRIWINSQKHKNFKGADGRPAEPFLYEFSTVAEELGLLPTPANPFAAPNAEAPRVATAWQPSPQMRIIQQPLIVKSEVVAFLEIRSNLDEGRPRPRSQGEYAVERASWLAVLRGDDVLSAAADDPELAMMRSGEDESELMPWLREHLEAEFPGDGQVLEVKLSCDTKPTDYEVKLLRAVLTRFEEKLTAAPTTTIAEFMAKPPEPGEAIPQQPGAGRLYDGKRLEEWMELWSTELKVSRRLDALEAIAAFAETGRPGVVELVLIYATEYPLPARSGNDDYDASRVLRTTVDLLAPQMFDETERPTPRWLAPLRSRLETDPQRYKHLAINLLERFGRPTAEAKRDFQSFADAQKDSEVRHAAEFVIHWLPTWGNRLMACDADGDEKVTVDEFVNGVEEHIITSSMFPRGPSALPQGATWQDVLREQAASLYQSADKNGDKALTRGSSWRAST